MTAARFQRLPVTFWAGVFLLLITLTLGWLFLPIREWVQSFTTAVRELGVPGAAIFAIVYAAAVVVLAPAWPFSVAAGLAFGVFGFPVVIISATIGASLAFLVARFVVREKVAGLMRNHSILEAIDRAVTEEGWKVVVLLRLTPLVPFNLQNYFLGATDIRFLPYVLATFFGIMPGAAGYVYAGMLGQITANADDGASGVDITLRVLGLAAAVVLIWLVGRKARTKLQALGVDKGAA
jgi:uncharacterized membrane protein YdjX (TVP38/TMEM64 family)